MKRLPLLFLAVLPFSAAAQERITESMVLTKDEAYVALPPEVVCQPHVTQMKWSADGSYLLLQRIDMNLSPMAMLQMLGSKTMPKAEASIVLWDNRNKRATEIWKGDAMRSNVSDFCWFSKSAVALISVMDRPQAEGEHATFHLIRLNAVTGKHERLWQMSSTLLREATLSASPATDHAVYAYPRFEIDKQAGIPVMTASIVHVVPAQGPAHQPLSLSSRADPSNVFVTAEGSFMLEESRFDPQVRSAVRQFHSINPQTLEVSRRPDMPKLWQHPSMLELVGVTAEAHEISVRGVKKKVHSLWMHSSIPSKFQFSMVAAEVGSYQMAKDLQAVAYITNGVGIVRPIARMPRAQVEDAIMAALRAELMSNGKQVALGLLMYAGDNNDVLPGQGADVSSLIEPYLKNTGLAKDFVYTFGGGDLSKVERPAETVLGYIQGPGGRAEVYVDGHVKWIKD